MAYVQLPTRTTADPNSATDVNQLQANIEAVKGGTGSTAPTTTVEALSTDKLSISAIDDVPADDADTCVSSQYVYNNIYKAFKVLDIKTVTTANYTILDNDGFSVFILGDAADADRTLTLPTAADNENRIIKILNYDATYKITIDGEGSEKIEYLANEVLTVDIDKKGAGLELLCDGALWHIVGTIGCRCELVGSAVELIYTKYLTGTTDADNGTAITHGIDVTKFVRAYASIYNSTASGHIACEVFREQQSTFQYSAILSSLTVDFSSVGTSCQGQTYKILLEYYI